MTLVDGFFIFNYFFPLLVGVAGLGRRGGVVIPLVGGRLSCSRRGRVTDAGTGPMGDCLSLIWLKMICSTYLFVVLVCAAEGAGEDLAVLSLPLAL